MMEVKVLTNSTKAESSDLEEFREAIDEAFIKNYSPQKPKKSGYYWMADFRVGLAVTIVKVDLPDTVSLFHEEFDHSLSEFDQCLWSKEITSPEIK